MTGIRKPVLALLFLIPLYKGLALPATAVFYGVESNSASSRDISMVQDLFFNQLSSLNNLTVTDRRGTTYTAEKNAGSLPRSGAIFYLEITESDGYWYCIFYGELPETGKKARYEKKYDSFYRILTEARSTIQAVISSLDAPDASSALPQSDSLHPSIDRIAGTWIGGEFIDKIVILRGGRGFVIYKNGASMNISVDIRDKTVIFRQAGKPNASFFPNIPREIALVSAQKADPIEWRMELTDENTLSGYQHSLVPVISDTDGSVISAQAGDTTVSWVRQSS